VGRWHHTNLTKKSQNFVATRCSKKSVREEGHRALSYTYRFYDPRKKKCLQCTWQWLCICWRLSSILCVCDHLRDMRNCWQVTRRKQRHSFTRKDLRIKWIGSSYCSAQESNGWEMIEHVVPVYEGSLSSGLWPSVLYLPQG
jgi:hypothetical protein